MSNTTPRRKARLLRYETSEQGTFGALFLDRLFFCYVGELPWRENERNYSCIPAGTYLCKLVDSPKFGSVYEISNVPDRSNILFHAGNYVGDVFKKLKTDSEGCILPGTSVGELNGQLAVISSRFQLQKLMAELNGDDFDLTILDSYE